MQASDASSSEDEEGEEEEDELVLVKALFPDHSPRLAATRQRFERFITHGDIVADLPRTTSTLSRLSRGSRASKTSSGLTKRSRGLKRPTRPPFGASTANRDNPRRKGVALSPSSSYHSTSIGGPEAAKHAYEQQLRQTQRLVAELLDDPAACGPATSAVEIAEAPFDTDSGEGPRTIPLVHAVETAMGLRLDQHGDIRHVCMLRRMAQRCAQNSLLDRAPPTSPRTRLASTAYKHIKEQSPVPSPVLRGIALHDALVAEGEQEEEDAVAATTAKQEQRTPQQHAEVRSEESEFEDNEPPGSPDHHASPALFSAYRNFGRTELAKLESVAPASAAFLAEFERQGIAPLPVLDYLVLDNDPGSSRRCRLEIPQYGLGDAAAVALGRFFQEHAELQPVVLDLARNHLGDTGLSAVLQGLLPSHAALERLNLSGNAFGQKAEEALLALLQPTPAPVAAGPGMLPFVLSMCELQLNSTNLSDAGLGQLFEALAQTAPSLSCLSVQRNRLGASVVKLAPLITHSQSRLIDLNLAWNAIAGDGAISLAAALRRNRRLTALNLGFNRVGSEHAMHELSLALAHHPALTRLDLAHNRVDQPACMVLMRCFETNTVLARLVLDGNPIGQGGVALCLRHVLAHPHRQFSFRSCEAESFTRTKWNVLTPRGEYNLDLASPAHRMLVDELRTLTTRIAPWVWQAQPTSLCFSNDGRKAARAPLKPKPATAPLRTTARQAAAVAPPPQDLERKEQQARRSQPQQDEDGQEEPQSTDPAPSAPSLPPRSDRPGFTTSSRTCSQHPFTSSLFSDLGHWSFKALPDAEKRVFWQPSPAPHLLLRPPFRVPVKSDYIVPREPTEAAPPVQQEEPVDVFAKASTREDDSRHDTSRSPWQNVRLNRKRCRLPPPGVSLPTKGLLTFTFDYRHGDRPPSPTDQQLGRLRELLEAHSEACDLHARQLLLTTFEMWSFSAAQGAQLLAWLPAGTRRVFAASKLLCSVNDRHNLDELLAPLHASECSELRGVVGKLLDFTPLNPNGSYRLNLGNVYDRALAQLVLEINEAHRGPVLRGEQADFSQIGGGHCLRNTTLNGQPVDVGAGRVGPGVTAVHEGGAAALQVPDEGWLAFDFFVRFPQAADSGSEASSHPVLSDFELRAFVEQHLRPRRLAAEDLDAAEAQRVFDSLDQDKFGLLASAEVKAALRQLGLAPSDAEFEEVIKPWLQAAVGNAPLAHTRPELDVGFGASPSQLLEAASVLCETREARRRRQAVQRQASTHWLSCEQVHQLLAAVSDATERVNMLVLLAARVLDPANLFFPLQLFARDDLADLRRRVGPAVLFNPCLPNGTYELDLAQQDHRLVAKLVLSLAMVEDKRKGRSGLQRPLLQGEPFKLSKTWLRDLSPEGLLSFDYCAVAPDEQERRALGRRVLRWATDPNPTLLDAFLDDLDPDPQDHTSGSGAREEGSASTCSTSQAILATRDAERRAGHAETLDERRATSLGQVAWDSDRQEFRFSFASNRGERDSFHSRSSVDARDSIQSVLRPWSAKQQARAEVMRRNAQSQSRHRQRG